MTKRKKTDTKKGQVNTKKKNDKDKIIGSIKSLGVKIKKIIEKILIILIKFLKKYWHLIVMNIIIFILTVFIESHYIYNLKLLMWFTNTILFVVIPTIVFSIIFKIKSKDIVLSIPMLYVLFLIFLDYCTLRDLYGITSGRLDIVPNFIDALMVVFIFTLFEYVTVVIINKIFRKKKIKK